MMSNNSSNKDQYYYSSVLDDFPVIDSNADYSLSSNISFEEILFEGQHGKYCVYFIDMVNSTVVTSDLTDIQISKYYSIFLNAMATIAINFGSKIIKNAGDCLICYFPSTLNITDNNNTKMHNVLECFVTMIDAWRSINSMLKSDRLPPVNYRISADYGEVEIAKSTTSNNDDLFGSTMNICAKINSKATENGIVIGHNLYEIARHDDFINLNFIFEPAGVYTIKGKDGYTVYRVLSKQKRSIINPFKRTCS